MKTTTLLLLLLIATSGCNTTTHYNLKFSDLFDKKETPKAQIEEPDLPPPTPKKAVAEKPKKITTIKPTATKKTVAASSPNAKESVVEKPKNKPEQKKGLIKKTKKIPLSAKLVKAYHPDLRPLLNKVSKYIESKRAYPVHVVIFASHETLIKYIKRRLESKLKTRNTTQDYPSWEGVISDDFYIEIHYTKEVK